ncbi:hypothetical protein TWF481_001601 [Arthrobotrys musiformis]|uniref:DUF7732 domain-containing protein n=1 Tax=Arthrobotrys musiformis TaxID=47236 RepID=A0AAV9VV01_9PEZI
MKYSTVFQAAATTFLFTAGVSAINPAARAIAHLQPLENAEDVANRIHFKERRAIKHAKPLEDAEGVAQRLTFDKRSVLESAIKHTAPLANAEDVSERLTFDKRDEGVSRPIEGFKPLEKRKGGGGGGKGGGGSSGGKSTSSGGKSTSSGGKSKTTTGGKSTSGGSKSSSSGSKSSGNKKGYKTYGGRYGGGASTGYKAGAKSPLGLAPFLLPLAAIALIFPGLWLYAVYSYHYNTLYQYYNNSLNAIQSVPVQCLCMQYSDCACDDNGNTTFIDELVALNQSNTTVFAVVDGVWTLLINGTVENGTGPAAGETINAGSSLNALGYLWMVAFTFYMVYTM